MQRRRLTFNLLKLSGLLLALSAPLHASSGTEGASFLDIPVGARPAALGSAYTALATDAYAPTWNPGGLGFLNDSEFAAQHLSYLDSIHYEYFGLVHPLATSLLPSKRGGLGFAVQYLGSGDITQTDGGGNTVGSFTSHWGSYNLSYGQGLSDKIALGITGKWINAKIDDVSANAYAVDFGSLYKYSEKINLAATLTNVGTQLTFLNEGDPLPLAFHAGMAYQPNSSWLVTSEGVFPRTGLESFHMGGQWRPFEAISLRLGYKTDTLKGLSPLAGFTAGLGIHAWGQEFAYAWAPYGDLGDAQYFSLLIHFGTPEENRRNLIRFKAIKTHRTVQERQDPDPDYEQLINLLNEEAVRVAQRNPVPTYRPPLHERVRPDMRQ